MAASTGKTGRGIVFEISNGASPPVWTKLANVTSMTFSGRDAEEIDFTILDATGGFRDLRQGFKDPGSIGLEIHVDPTNATYQDLLTKFLSGDLFDWRINYSAAGWPMAELGQGFIKNPGDTNINVSDPVGGTATVRVTGATSFVNPS